MATINESAVWAYSNTGTLAHAFLATDPANGRLRAACRASITREADAILYAAEDVRANGRVCANCEAKWASHMARVEGSMMPVTPTGEPTGAAPEQPANDAPATRLARLQRPTFKTIIKAESTWVLQSRKDNTDTWSYVSDHGSEEAATLRAQAFLIEGSRRQFRVVEHRTEVRATDPIEPPKGDVQPGARYVVKVSEDNRNAVVDTITGEQVFSAWSRYPVVAMASDLNDGSVVVDRTGAIVQAPAA